MEDNRDVSARELGIKQRIPLHATDLEFCDSKARAREQRNGCKWTYRRRAEASRVRSYHEATQFVSPSSGR
jgi:hypothetical protein